MEFCLSAIKYVNTGIQSLSPVKDRLLKFNEQIPKQERLSWTEGLGLSDS